MAFESLELVGQVTQLISYLLDGGVDFAHRAQYLVGVGGLGLGCLCADEVLRYRRGEDGDESESDDHDAQRDQTPDCGCRCDVAIADRGHGGDRPPQPIGDRQVVGVVLGSFGED